MVTKGHRNGTIR